MVVLIVVDETIDLVDAAFGLTLVVLEE